MFVKLIIGNYLSVIQEEEMSRSQELQYSKIEWVPTEDIPQKAI